MVSWPASQNSPGVCVCFYVFRFSLSFLFCRVPTLHALRVTKIIKNRAGCPHFFVGVRCFGLVPFSFAVFQFRICFFSNLNFARPRFRAFAVRTCFGFWFLRAAVRFFKGCPFLDFEIHFPRLSRLRDLFFPLVSDGFLRGGAILLPVRTVFFSDCRAFFSFLVVAALCRRFAFVFLFSVFANNFRT